MRQRNLQLEKEQYSVGLHPQAHDCMAVIDKVTDVYEWDDRNIEAIIEYEVHSMFPNYDTRDKEVIYDEAEENMNEMKQNMAIGIVNVALDELQKDDKVFIELETKIQRKYGSDLLAFVAQELEGIEHSANFLIVCEEADRVINTLSDMVGGEDV